MEWYERYKFKSNPLEINSFIKDFHTINLNDKIQNLQYLVVSGAMVLVIGTEGTGKTALLYEIIKTYKGRGKIIYVDAEKLNKRLDIESLLVRRYGFFRGIILGQKPKGMILLLDNVHKLSKKNCRLIKYYFDQDYLQSVVFTANDFRYLEIAESILSRIGKNIIKMNSISEDDAISLLKYRLGTEIFNIITIKNLYSFSNGNAKKLLQHAEILLKYDKLKATKEEIAEIISSNGVHSVQKDICDICESELVEINSSWRCPKCEHYCGKCGQIVEEEICPDCKAVLIEVENGRN